MIRLNCFFQAEEGKYAEAIEAALALTACSKNDEGCISYDVFESGTRNDVFMFCETWADEASLDKHSNSEHFTKYVDQLGKLGKMKIEKFQF